MTINLVTEQQVKELEQKLKVTDRNLPIFSQIEFQLAEAQSALEAKKRIIKKAGKKGYRPNPTDGNCASTGERIKANCGFTKKNSYGGWDIFSWEIVQDEVM